MSKKEEKKPKYKRQRQFDEDALGFQKIRKRTLPPSPDYPRYASDDDRKKIDSQQFGTGHLVHDSLVHFGGNRSQNSFHDYRPMVVSTPPTSTNRFMTTCHPCSTGDKNRDPKDTVFLSKNVNPDVPEDCYILLNPDYTQYFRYNNLLNKRFDLIESKKKELKDKLQKLEGKHELG